MELRFDVWYDVIGVVIVISSEVSLHDVYRAIIVLVLCFLLTNSRMRCPLFDLVTVMG